MITAVEWARTRRVPFFGICLGMQMAVVEYARNVCGLKRATVPSSMRTPPTP